MNGKFLDNRIIKVKEKNNEEQKNNKNNYIKKKKSLKGDNTSSDEEEKNSLKNTFGKNIELLESDNIDELYKKMKESIDKMLEYYKGNKKINEISRLIIYYSSH